MQIISWKWHPENLVFFKDKIRLVSYVLILRLVSYVFNPRYDTYFSFSVKPSWNLKRSISKYLFSFIIHLTIIVQCWKYKVWSNYTMFQKLSHLELTALYNQVRTKLEPKKGSELQVYSLNLLLTCFAPAISNNLTITKLWQVKCGYTTLTNKRTASMMVILISITFITQGLDVNKHISLNRE